MLCIVDFVVHNGPKRDAEALVSPSARRLGRASHRKRVCQRSLLTPRVTAAPAAFSGNGSTTRIKFGAFKRKRAWNVVPYAARDQRLGVWRFRAAKQ